MICSLLLLVTAGIAMAAPIPFESAQVESSSMHKLSEVNKVGGGEGSAVGVHRRLGNVGQFEPRDEGDINPYYERKYSREQNSDSNGNLLEGMLMTGYDSVQGLSYRIANDASGGCSGKYKADSASTECIRNLCSKGADEYKYHTLRDELKKFCKMLEPTALETFESIDHFVQFALGKASGFNAGVQAVNDIQQGNVAGAIAGAISGAVAGKIGGAVGGKIGGAVVGGKIGEAVGGKIGKASVKGQAKDAARDAFLKKA